MYTNNQSHSHLNVSTSASSSSLCIQYILHRRQIRISLCARLLYARAHTHKINLYTVHSKKEKDIQKKTSFAARKSSARSINNYTRVKNRWANKPVCASLPLYLSSIRSLIHHIDANNIIHARAALYYYYYYFCFSQPFIVFSRRP